MSKNPSTLIMRGFYFSGFGLTKAALSCKYPLAPYETMLFDMRVLVNDGNLYL